MLRKVPAEQAAGCRPRLLGEALPGNRVFLRDVNPDGIGELWIGGPQVGKGYLNNCAATEASFVDDPEHGWCLKTGDMARSTEYGDLELVGRRDFMVVA
jgi:long-subunit acyl-CoA synthetase (AMP-forming)